MPRLVNSDVQIMFSILHYELNILRHEAYLFTLFFFQQYINILICIKKAALYKGFDNKVYFNFLPSSNRGGGGYGFFPGRSKTPKKVT